MGGQLVPWNADPLGLRRNNAFNPFSPFNPLGLGLGRNNALNPWNPLGFNYHPDDIYEEYGDALYEPPWGMQRCHHRRHPRGRRRFRGHPHRGCHRQCLGCDYCLDPVYDHPGYLIPNYGDPMQQQMLAYGIQVAVNAMGYQRG